jgi:hypothetical protein
MAKKMILIDPRLLESMNQKQQYVPPDTLNDSLRTLDNQMHQVLTREDLSLRDKARQYQQTLQRYMGRLDDYRHKPLGLVDMNPPPTQTFEQPQVSSPVVPKTEDPAEIRQSTKRQKKDDVDEIAKRTQDTSPPYTRSRSKKKKKSKIPTPVKWIEKWDEFRIKQNK